LPYLETVFSAIKILPAEHDDFHVIRSALQQNKLIYSDLDSRLPHFFKATSNQTLSGCIGLEIYGSHGLLRSLWVAPAFRNQGLAQNLVNTLEVYATGLNLQNLYLLTETAETFFSKRGYQRLDRLAAPEALKGSAEFKSLCPDSAALMVKNLSGQ